MTSTTLLVNFSSFFLFFLFSLLFVCGVSLCNLPSRIFLPVPVQARRLTKCSFLLLRKRTPATTAATSGKDGWPCIVIHSTTRTRSRSWYLSTDSFHLRSFSGLSTVFSAFVFGLSSDSWSLLSSSPLYIHLACSYYPQTLGIHVVSFIHDSPCSSHPLFQTLFANTLLPSRQRI